MKLKWAALLLMLVGKVAASDALLALPPFRSLEDQANEVMNIALDAETLALAARFLDESKAEDAAVKQLVTGLRGIYVKSFTFDADFTYPTADIETVRKQLVAPDWQRLMEVRSRRQQTRVDVYLSMDRGQANGLTLIASEPREFTIVNLVGSVDLEKLHRLEGRFGVPKLELEHTGPAAAQHR